MLPIIDLEKVSLDVVAGDTIEIGAKVTNLMPGCNLKWESSNQKGFAFIDSQNVILNNIFFQSDLKNDIITVRIISKCDIC